MDGRTPQRPDREVQISAKQSNLTRKHPADKVPQGLLRGRGEGPDLPGGRRCGGTGRTANGRPYGCTDFAPTRRDEHCSSGLCRIDGHEAGGQGGRNCGETGQSWREESSGNMTKNEKESLCKLTNREAKRRPELTISLQKTILSAGK